MRVRVRVVVVDGGSMLVGCGWGLPSVPTKARTPSMAACGMRCTMRGRSSGTPTPEVGSQVVVSEEGRAAVSESNGIPSYTASNLLTHLLTYLLMNLLLLEY